MSFSLDSDNLMESFDELTGKNERFWWEEENGYYGIMVRSYGNSQKIQSNEQQKLPPDDAACIQKHNAVSCDVCCGIAVSSFHSVSHI